MKTETFTPETSTSIDRYFASHQAAAEPAAVPIGLQNILVPLDFSETSLKSLQYAVAFAKQFGGKLTLLHVIEPIVCTPEMPNPPALESERRDTVMRGLTEIREAHIPAGIESTVAVRSHFAIDGILEEAREIRADLIITSTHGYSGLKHLLLGSTAENIVQKAPCPVLVVKEREHDFV